MPEGLGLGSVTDTKTLDDVACCLPSKLFSPPVFLLTF